MIISRVKLYFRSVIYPKPNFIKHERVIGLDLVRAIAIIAVVIGHTFWYLRPFNQLPLIGQALNSFIDCTHDLAEYGVELFFVLSGFLIGGILIRTFMKEDHFSKSALLSFWSRRWFRTLPNYWLLLTVALILQKLMKINEMNIIVWHDYLFLQNLWYPCTDSFFTEGWSLAIEEWFYLSLPLVVYFLRLVFPSTPRKQFLLRVFFGYALVFIIVRLINAFAPINGLDPDEGIRKVVLFRLDAVMYGVLFAWLGYFRQPLLEKFKKKLLYASFIATALLYFFTTKYVLIFYTHFSFFPRFMRDAFLFLIMPLMLSLSLPFAASINFIRNHALSNCIRHISKISYSLYLVHFTLVFMPFFHEHRQATPLGAFCVYLLYWAIVIGLSSLIYYAFELPVMKFRDRFLSKS